MADLQKLRQVIQDEHDVKCTHIRSEHVREVLEGGRVWEGDVETFSCTDNPSMLVYGWAKNGDYEIVLGKGPIRSARAAVRAALAPAALRIGPRQSQS